MVCSPSELAKLVESCPFAHVILSGQPAAQLRARAAGCAFQLHSFSDVEANGRAHLAILPSLPSARYSDLAVLCYTSGTTGAAEPHAATTAAGQGRPLHVAMTPRARVHTPSLPLASRTASGVFRVTSGVPGKVALAARRSARRCPPLPAAPLQPCPQPACSLVTLTLYGRPAVQGTPRVPCSRTATSSPPSESVRAPMSFGLGVTLPHARAAARSHAPMRSAAVARNRTATRAMQPVLMCGAQPELGG